MTNAFFDINLLLGVIMLLTGIITHFFPPKKINMIYGYRTQRSMKDKANWDLAQKLCSRELMTIGIAQMALANAGWFIDLPETPSVLLGLGIFIVLIVRLFLKVEKALKQLG